MVAVLKVNDEEQPEEHDDGVVVDLIERSLGGARVDNTAEELKEGFSPSVP